MASTSPWATFAAYALEVCGSTPPRRKYIEALLKKGLEAPKELPEPER